MQQERFIQNQILSYLKIKGIFAWHAKNGATYDARFKGYRHAKSNVKGIADIIGILPDGRMLAIEVKTPKGRVSKEQELFINIVNGSNGLAFVARSVDDVIERL